MNSRKIQNTLSMLAGLSIAPTVWAINMQLGQMLPYIDCAQQSRLSAIYSFAGSATALIAGGFSWNWTRPEKNTSSLTATSRFIARLGALSALIFAFALALQGIASLVLSGCER
jgi:hypothetical protein